MIYMQLFYEFFKVGLFAVGGGLAALPFLYNISDTTAWFTHTQLADMVAISESTPGPIGINMATYVGYTTAGIAGSVIATFAMVLPSLIIVLIVARFLQSFRDNKIVQSVFYGLRPASVGLIMSAGFAVLKISLLDLSLYEQTNQLLDAVQWKALALAVVLYFVLRKWKLHPIVVIAASAVIGIVFGFAGA